MRATRSELAVWRQRITDLETRLGFRGCIERELLGALESERWHTIDLEARVREQAADRRELVGEYADILADAAVLYVRTKLGKIGDIKL